MGFDDRKEAWAFLEGKIVHCLLFGNCADASAFGQKVGLAILNRHLAKVPHMYRLEWGCVCENDKKIGQYVTLLYKVLTIDENRDSKFKLGLVIVVSEILTICN